MAIVKLLLNRFIRLIAEESQLHDDVWQEVPYVSAHDAVKQCWIL
jgi:hypothetical protein